jgi:hypothetical protein
MRACEAERTNTHKRCVRAPSLPHLRKVRARHDDHEVELGQQRVGGVADAGAQLAAVPQQRPEGRAHLWVAGLLQARGQRKQPLRSPQRQAVRAALPQLLRVSQEQADDVGLRACACVWGGGGGSGACNSTAQ